MPDTLTPAQIRGLKLAKDGDLHPCAEGKWTHLDATETYARTDRFKERPIKVKCLSSTTIEDLQGFGFITQIEGDIKDGTQIFRASKIGKVWLLMHK